MSIPTMPATVRHDPNGQSGENGRPRRALLPSLMPEVAVYVALVLLGATSVGLAFAGLFGAYAILACLAVSSVMAVLVTRVFMHLRTAMTVVLLAGLAGVVWLTILFGLTMADYVTRPDGQLTSGGGGGFKPGFASRVPPAPLQEK